VKLAKWLAIAVTAYVVLVIGLEGLVTLMGSRHADRGLEPGETWVVLTTRDDDGSRKDTVVAAVESGGKLYVSANHWPRAWYRRARTYPDVEVVRNGEKAARLAVPVEGAERERVLRDYPLPFVLRLLTGFPPRAFLRLDPP
jgi:hypothetical protein